MAWKSLTRLRLENEEHGVHGSTCELDRRQDLHRTTNLFLERETGEKECRVSRVE
jgi:hypothetical protein